MGNFCWNGSDLGLRGNERCFGGNEIERTKSKMEDLHVGRFECLSLAIQVCFDLCFTFLVCVGVTVNFCVCVCRLVSCCSGEFGDWSEFRVNGEEFWI